MTTVGFFTVGEPQKEKVCVRAKVFLLFSPDGARVIVVHRDSIQCTSVSHYNWSFVSSLTSM